MNPYELKKLMSHLPGVFSLIIIAWLVLPYLFLDPAKNETDRILSELKQNVAKARKYVRKSVRIKDIENRINKITKVVKHIRNQLPERHMLPVIIESFYEIAFKNKIIINSIRYEFKKRYENMKVSAYKIQFNLKADYADLRTFLANLEQLKYPLIIRKVLVSDSGNYNVSVAQLVKSYE